MPENEILLGLLSKLAIALALLSHTFSLIDEYLFWGIVLFVLILLNVVLGFVNWKQGIKDIRSVR